MYDSSKILGNSRNEKKIPEKKEGKNSLTKVEASVNAKLRGVQ